MQEPWYPLGLSLKLRGQGRQPPTLPLLLSHVNLQSRENGTGNWCEDELFYNPILCFVQKNLAKRVSPDTIKEYMANFFESSSHCETHKLLFLKLFPNEVPLKRVGANAELNCASDIFSSLVK